MADENNQTQDTAQTQAAGIVSPADENVSLIVQRRDESRKYMKERLWDELTEVYRAIKCRTKPIMKRDSAGQETNDEDKSRTNVCMPDLNIIFRRNTARMTAQPYRLRYTGGNEVVAEQLSALSAKQYDNSNEAREDLRVVMAAEAMGFGYSKLFWNTINQRMKLRRALQPTGRAIPATRSQLMQLQGAGPDEIQGAVQEKGEQLQPREISAAVAQYGPAITVEQKIKKYEGPALKCVFPGDLSLEPGCLTLDASDWTIEHYIENDLWLEDMVKNLVYKDDKGRMVNAFDKEACQALLDLNPGPDETDQNIQELRQMFETAIGAPFRQIPRHLRVRKQFDILEQHVQRDDGRMWITWCSERYRAKPLGQMPYPWDLYGKTAYSELVPLPDLISCYGDSTPRLLRFLHAMHNLTVAQNFDYITNLIKKLILRKTGLGLGQEVVTRGMFRELEVEDLNGVKVLEEPPLPPGAMEREAQILQMMGIAEPSLMNVNAGTDANPMAGKTATTALLGAKAADALTQFKLDGRNLYLREVGMKKLWMNQQAAEDPWDIEQKFFPDALNQRVKAGFQEPPNWLVTDNYGKVASVRLHPLEIQEDYGVEPEAGSYLSVDDDLRTDAATKLGAVAAQAPGVINMRKVVRFALSTIRGIGNPDDYLLPEPQGPAPPPPPRVNVNIGLTGKLPDIPPDVANEALQAAGFQPSPEMAQQGTIDAIGKLSHAADQVDNLTSPPSEAQPDQNESKGTPKQAAATKG